MHKIAGLVVTCALVSVTGCGSHDAGHGGTTAAAPASVAISAITTDAVYVVNGGDSTIAVLDASSGSVLGKIQLTNVSYPHHVYLSPDRSKIAVAVPGHDLSMGHSAAAQPGGSARRGRARRRGSFGRRGPRARCDHWSDPPFPPSRILEPQLDLLA